MKTAVLLLLCIFLIPTYGANIQKNYYNNGEKSLKEKNYIQAVSEFTKALENDSELIEAYAERGNAYFELLNMLLLLLSLTKGQLI